MDGRIKYLSYADFSTQSGLSISTLQRRVKEGRLRSVQPGGPRTRVLIPTDALEATPPKNDAPPPPAAPQIDPDSRLPGRPPDWLKKRRPNT